MTFESNLFMVYFILVFSIFTHTRTQAGGSVEITWVVTDYNATPGTTEVSVTKGQQVEIIETACNGAPDFCLVRLNIHSGSAADGSGTIEGIVPVSVLKFAPSAKSSNRKGADASSENKESTENNGKFRIRN